MDERIFLEIESGDLINLSLIDRVILRHASHQQVALLYQGGMVMAESTVAYRYFADPANFDRIVIPAKEVHERWAELQAAKKSAN